jgi:hypothetical protein
MSDEQQRLLLIGKAHEDKKRAQLALTAAEADLARVTEKIVALLEFLRSGATTSRDWENIGLYSDVANYPALRDILERIQAQQQEIRKSDRILQQA